MIRVLVLLTALASAPLLSGQSAGGAAAGTTLALIPAFGNLKLYLGLTDFQLEQLVQIVNEQNEALMENYRQIAQKEAELYNLLNSGSQDLHRIGRLTVDMHQADALNLIGLEAVSLRMPGIPPIMGSAGTSVVPSPQ